MNEAEFRITRSKLLSLVSQAKLHMQGDQSFSLGTLDSHDHTIKVLKVVSRHELLAGHNS